MSPLYVCQECGNEFALWQGKCSYCSSWDSLKQVSESFIKASKVTDKLSSIDITRLDKVDMNDIHHLTTGSSEFDRALSGGLVQGSITLIGGDPGIGKSTLMLQISHSIANSLYVSGEESESQIALRAKRLGVDPKRINILCDTNIENITKQIIKFKPRMVVIDSIQTMFSKDQISTPGSIVQIRSATMHFQKIAKQTSVPIILVGHVTKEGIVAGPKILEHIVDTVCYLEGNNEENLRFIRTVKHRFGSVNEIGIFEMTDKGLNSLANPSLKFIQSKTKGIFGSVISVIVEGKRPILVEIQALISKSYSNFPKRIVSGTNPKRLDILLAIIEKKTGVLFYDQDVFINLTGGLKHMSNDIDLAITCAILSSYYKKSIPEKWCVFGELGLTGETRDVAFKLVREKEAKRLGYEIISQIVSLKDFANKIKSLS